MLDIRPFEYGLVMVAVYDNGTTYEAGILDMTDAEILSRFTVGIGNVAALSLGISFPTSAAFPHVVLNGYKNLLAIAVSTDYVFDQAALVKQMAENPDAFASTTSSSTTGGGGHDKPDEKVEVEKEPSEEEDEGLGFDLFG